MWQIRKHIYSYFYSKHSALLRSAPTYDIQPIIRDISLLYYK